MIKFLTSAMDSTNYVSKYMNIDTHFRSFEYVRSCTYPLHSPQINLFAVFGTAHNY